MPCHLEAEVSPVVFFSSKTILIRALLSTSYVDSFDRKLLDSDLELSHMTKHMVF